MTRVKIPVDQMKETIHHFKIRRNELEQILITHRNILIQIQHDFLGISSQRLLSDYEHAEKVMYSILGTIDQVATTLENVVLRFQNTDSGNVELYRDLSLEQMYQLQNLTRTSNLMDRLGYEPESSKDGFIQGASDQLNSSLQDWTSFGENAIEHPFETAANMLYSNTIGTAVDIGNIIKFGWNFTFNFGDAREQAEQTLNYQKEQLDEQGWKYYSGGVTTQAAMFFIGKKLGMPKHNKHDDAGSGGSSGDSKMVDQQPSKIDIDTKAKINSISSEMLENGPTWKSEELLQKHLTKRIKKGHIPEDWTIEDYNSKITQTLKNPENDLYEYSQPDFQQKYYIFGDGEWIVMVGEDGIMETAFPPDRGYTKYLQEEINANYIGKIKDVD
ncbi:hypothetical protein ACM7Q1_23120 [Paenibacillus illinoisensis]|uniref:hypothetical protein n=1 Tax=Paenibacillus illinoisensis TaxID=59845 RepID=UPI003A4E4727